MNEPKTRDVSEALARGVRAAETLGAETDALTETLAHIERALTELRLGVEASIDLSREEEDVEDESVGTLVHEECLRFGKVGKRWTLAVLSATHPIDDDWRVTPLVNASRELRLLAVDKLPELIDKLVLRAEQRLAEVNDRHSKAREILGALVAMRAKKEAP